MLSHQSSYNFNMNFGELQKFRIKLLYQFLTFLAFSYFPIIYGNVVVFVYHKTYPCKSIFETNFTLEIVMDQSEIKLQV